MKVCEIGADGLAGYVARQLAHFFPDGGADPTPVIVRNLGEALARLRRCINAVRIWPKDAFDYLHTEQNTIFLYLLANTVWRNERDERIATKLYYLNKALNAFNCFYEVELPDIFFVGHSLGIVLSRASYSNYFAVYQNSTVGWNDGVWPTFEEGVVMFPGSCVLGRCVVRRGTILSQGTSLIDVDTEPGAIAYRSKGELQFRAPRRDILGAIFRLEERQ
jgi:serine O-acetyltransferase